MPLDDDGRNFHVMPLPQLEHIVHKVLLTQTQKLIAVLRVCLDPGALDQRVYHLLQGTYVDFFGFTPIDSLYKRTPCLMCTDGVRYLLHPTLIV